jgi:hypothetical protein
MSFFKMKDRKVKQVFFRGGYRWNGRGHKERVKEGKYSETMTYSSVSMEQWDLLKLI